jgi:hypothetical protein
MSKEKKEIIHYADQYDIPRVSPSEAIQQIKLGIKYDQFGSVICLVGQSGVGKSQIIHQVARDMNLSKVADIRTAHFSILGGGVPKLQSESNRFFNILLPPQFPEEDESAIIFFDEINQGMSHAISMFFSLIEDRRIYDYELGNKVSIIAAMNPNTAQYVVQNIESNAAIRRRLKFMFVISNAKDFLEHARTSQFHYTDMVCKAIGPQSKPCHPSVLEFLESSPSCIEDAKARDNNKQYPCPATWQKVSTDCYVMEKEGIPLTGDFARVRFAGTIGMTMAQQLSGYIQDKSAFINADEVVLKFEKVRPKLEKLVENGALERLVGLTTDVLEYIFINEPPDVNATAENFIKYLQIIPNDASIAAMQQIASVASANKAQIYLNKLMRGLRNQPAFIDFNKRIEDSHKSIENKLK